MLPLIAEAQELSYIGTGSENEVLKFEGVPIEGSVKDFSDALIKKGYGYYFPVRDDFPVNFSILKGEFLGLDCRINLWGDNSQENELITGVFISVEDWDCDIFEEYNRISELYLTKYGEPQYNKDKVISWDMVNKQGEKYGSIIVGLSKGHLSISYRKEIEESKNIKNTNDIDDTKKEEWLSEI